MAECDVLDPAALADLLETTGRDPVFLAELIDTYLEDAAGLLGAMQRALADTNPAEMRRAAHSLKSSSATFGARTLFGMCQELERRAQAGILVDAAPLLASIEAAHAQVACELRMLRANA